MDKNSYFAEQVEQLIHGSFPKKSGKSKVIRINAREFFRQEINFIEPANL